MINFKVPSASCALLIIDMQNGFVHPESAMGKSPSGTSSQVEMVPRIIQLMEIARARKIPVILSQQEHFPDDKTRNRKTFKPHSQKQGFLPCLRGSWEVDLYPDIKNNIKDNDHLVSKHRASVFYNTNLETKLRMLGTQFLIISGCNTEFCVESTVRDAYARDFEIIVIKDCIAGINKAYHENSLKVFQDYFGEVIFLNELEECLDPK